MHAIDKDGTLTIHEYNYLKGDEAYWDVKGAAFNSVYEWCKNHGYGTFGEPTERGKKAMYDYRHRHSI